MCILLPPRSADEEPRLAVRHHHICQVRKYFLIYIRIYSILLQRDLHSWPEPPWWLLWHAGVWMEEAKPSQHHVLLVGSGSKVDTKRWCSGMRSWSRTRRGWWERFQTLLASLSLKNRFRWHSWWWLAQWESFSTFYCRSWMSTWNLTTFKRQVRQTRKVQTGRRSQQLWGGADQNCRFEGKGQFIRKGIVGDWMNHFTPQLNKVSNRFCQCPILVLREQITRFTGFREITIIPIPANERCEKPVWRNLV